MQDIYEVELIDMVKVFMLKVNQMLIFQCSTILINNVGPMKVRTLTGCSCIHAARQT